MRPSGRRPATSTASKRSPAWLRARASCARRNGWTASGLSPRISGSRRRPTRPHDAPRVVPERLLPARRASRPARAGVPAARAVPGPVPPRGVRGPGPAGRRRPRARGRPADPALRRAVRRAGPGHSRRAAAPVPRAATGDRQDGDLRDARRPRGAAGGHAHRAAARRPAGGPGRAGRVSAGAGRGGPCVSRLPRHPGNARMTAELAREMAELTIEHLVLVAVSIAVAIAVALPAGILLTRRAPLQRWVLGFANVMQTVPSLALFGFLIPIPLLGGIGKHTAIVALVLYALLPVLRNTLTGILGVDRAVRESAIAMGMTGRQLLWEVELPLAARTILAGVRVATVTTIGTATIAAAIGGGGLGVFIFRGLASVDTTLILAGAVPAALIALLADGGLGWAEKKLSPV